MVSEGEFVSGFGLGGRLGTKGVYISQPSSTMIGMGKFVPGPTLRDATGRCLMVV
jgi:hypothetical protein